MSKQDKLNNLNKKLKELTSSYSWLQEDLRNMREEIIELECEIEKVISEE